MFNSLNMLHTFCTHTSIHIMKMVNRYLQISTWMSEGQKGFFLLFVFMLYLLCFKFCLVNMSRELVSFNNTLLWMSNTSVAVLLSSLSSLSSPFVAVIMKKHFPSDFSIFFFFFYFSVFTFTLILHCVQTMNNRQRLSHATEEKTSINSRTNSSALLNIIVIIILSFTTTNIKP